MNILVVEDEPAYCQFLEHQLKELGHWVTTACDGASALENASLHDIDLVFLDHRLPGQDGVEVLRILKKQNPDLPVVMMTAYGHVQSAVEAIKAGAQDYVVKEDLSATVIEHFIAKVEEQQNLRAENQRLWREIADQSAADLVVGKSPQMQAVLDKVRRIAPFHSTVLICGESGTGKEVLARLIHRLSRVRHRPFVTVNCAAIPETLLESELFGYAKGAFSGAYRSKRGLFEEANGGTLLLDEIGELPLTLQVKLLRVLQEGTLRRLGDVHEIRVDVRIIAATSRHLADEVRAGRFREDLYYRLNIIPITVPPLRERADDIPLLVQHFLRRLCKDGDPPVVTPEAMRILTNYSWPGNVRELQNVLERAVILSDHHLITSDSLPPEMRSKSESLQVRIPNEHLSIKRTLAELVPRIEKELIQRALKLTGNNRTRAAKLLEISHRSLLYKLKEYQCKQEDAA